MYLYKNCRDLPIYNFDIVFRENDLKYLVVGYDGYCDVTIPDGAETHWEMIKKEWIKALGDKTLEYKQQLMLEVNYLQVRFNVVAEVIQLLEYSILDKELIDAYSNILRPWGYIYNKKKKVKENLVNLKNQHKFSQNKLKDKLSELEKLTENDKDENVSLEKQAVYLAQCLNRNRIDTKKTTVLEWIELKNLAKEINSKSKRNGK